ncbi:hypothetical protein SEA_PIONEER3_2 [Microbacterium phage Pioneer3]|nr:hypothetical protein SEA_PIONEER3_113 [Microbacterium phage Pioneer3]AWY05936.1 hypothetical protein SEA_PIONEER3_2 [Microbacterium phage Pioneer3]
MSTIMPPNPHTGLVNVTPGEVADALAATEDVTLVREDGTLTPAGALYVADVRRYGHDDCEECYAVACDAQYAADPSNRCQHDNGVEDVEGVEVCDMCGETVEPHA